MATKAKQPARRASPPPTRNGKAPRSRAEDVEDIDELELEEEVTEDADAEEDDGFGVAPAAKRPAPKAKAQMAPAPQGGTDYWKNVFSNLNSGGDSNFLFPKTGKLQVRLIRKPGEPFFTEVNSVYQGRSKVKYLLLAWAPQDRDQTTQSPVYAVKGLILPKTAFKQLTGFLAEGYELFSPREGYGVTIMRTGTARDTQYTILPSRNPIPLPPQLKEEIAKTGLGQMADAYAKMMESRTGNQAQTTPGEEEEEVEDW